MRVKILGVALCILGVAGLITSLIYISVIGNVTKVSLLLVAGLASAAAFFIGLRLIPSVPKIITEPSGRTYGINIVHPERSMAKVPTPVVA